MSKVIHLDLFSGIGGFAYAVDQVWDNVEHIFCDNDKFCQQVLKKHWPESKVYDDIRQIDTNSFGKRLERSQQKQAERYGRQSSRKPSHQKPFILTGGFPCQPFSQAGARRGTADERHLWPEMLRVIRLTKPTWVIAENVRGLLTWDNGVQFEQVCLDLEASGYEVQPFIIPAVAVNAPHRRDRIWFVGHTKHDGFNGAENTESDNQGSNRNTQRPDKLRQPQRADSLWETTANTTHGSGTSRRDKRKFNTQSPEKRQAIRCGCGSLHGIKYGWEQNWQEVAAATCIHRMDDGISRWLVRLPNGETIPKGKWRQEALKAYGNAIVPQIAVEIMKGIAHVS